MLTSGTEVSVAPKIRGTVSGTAPPPTTTERGKSSDSAREASPAENRSRVLRVLPARSSSGYDISCPSLDNGSATAVAVVSRALLNEIANQAPYARPRAWRAAVQRLAPPADPSKDSSSSPIHAPAVPRVLVPQFPDTPKSNSESVTAHEPEPEVLVTWIPGLLVPDAHVTLFGSVPGLEDFDNVK